MSKTKFNARVLTESAVFLSMAVVLSFTKLINMPFGGSVTFCSMLPIILVSFRTGVKNGLLVGFCYSFLQLLFDMSTLSYATSASAAIAIIVLDYLVAFTVLGLGGLFKKHFSQTSALVLGSILVCALRFICHVITGCTVWAGISIPTADGLWYSVCYNAAYMIPETLVTVIVSVYISGILNLSQTKVSMKAETNDRISIILNSVSGFVGSAAVIYDALAVFAALQTEDGFTVQNISAAPWNIIGIVTILAAVIISVLLIINWVRKKK